MVADVCSRDLHYGNRLRRMNVYDTEQRYDS